MHVPVLPLRAVACERAKVAVAACCTLKVALSVVLGSRDAAVTTQTVISTVILNARVQRGVGLAFHPSEEEQRQSSI
jgi:hypothetical protein